MYLRYDWESDFQRDGYLYFIYLADRLAVLSIRQKNSITLKSVDSIQTPVRIDVSVRARENFTPLTIHMYKHIDETSARLASR